MTNEVVGLVLMGGKSTRMGTDKAFIDWNGLPLFQQAINQLKPLVSSVFLSVNNEQFGELGHEYACIIDEHPDKGPLGGIISALEYLKKDLLVVAVDMPEISHKTLQKLLPEGSSFHVRAYSDDENWLPLPSFWPAQQLANMKESLKNGWLALQDFLKSHGQKLYVVSKSDEFRNLNKPENL